MATLINERVTDANSLVARINRDELAIAVGVFAPNPKSSFAHSKDQNPSCTGFRNINDDV